MSGGVRISRHRGGAMTKYKFKPGDEVRMKDKYYELYGK